MSDNAAPILYPMWKQSDPMTETIAMTPAQRSRANLRAGNPNRGPNKATRMLKEAILQAADEAGGKEGLVGYLRTQAIKNPNAFMSLLGKVIPFTIQGDKQNPIEIRVTTAAAELGEIIDGMASNIGDGGK